MTSVVESVFDKHVVRSANPTLWCQFNHVPGHGRSNFWIGFGILSKSNQKVSDSNELLCQLGSGAYLKAPAVTGSIETSVYGVVVI